MGVKRWQKIITGVSLLLAVWVWSYSHLDLVCWLGIAGMLAALLATHAAVDILGSILSIRACPAEAASLNADIQRARDYYRGAGVEWK